MSEEDDVPARRKGGRRGRRRQIEDDDDDDKGSEAKEQSEPVPEQPKESSDAPKKRGGRGRRGRRQIDDDDDDDDDDNDGGGSAAGDAGGGEEEEEEDRNTGWGSSAKPKAKRDRETDKHKSAANWDDDAEGNDAIMVIPTLSSEDEEDVKGPDKDAIAQAPQANTLLPRAHELDEDIKGALSTATASGMDLSILTACLVPQNLILEEDEHWQFDELLQEVAIELQEEAEDKNRMMSQSPGEVGNDDNPDDF